MPKFLSILSGTIILSHLHTLLLRPVRIHANGLSAGKHIFVSADTHIIFLSAFQLFDGLYILFVVLNRYRFDGFFEFFVCGILDFVAVCVLPLLFSSDSYFLLTGGQLLDGCLF